MSVAADRGQPGHLPFTLAAVMGLLCGVFLGMALGALIPVLIASLPVAGALWGIVHYGFGGRRSAALAGPYLIILWAAVAAGGIGTVAWRQWSAAEATAAAARVKIDRNARDASVAKARVALDPQAASRVVETFIADVRAANGGFAREAAERGYTDAIGAVTLSNPASLGAAPERIRSVRPLFEETRDRLIRRTEAAATAVKALPVQTEEQKILVEDMLDELSRNRSARREYWDAMLDSADALEGMARVLVRTQGAWTADMATRSIRFVNDADAAAYEAEAFRRQEFEAEADRQLGRLNRSADALTTMAKRWAE